MEATAEADWPQEVRVALGKKVPHQIRTDESGTAGDEESHVGLNRLVTHGLGGPCYVFGNEISNSFGV